MLSAGKYTWLRGRDKIQISNRSVAAGKVSLLHGRSLSNNTRGEDTREFSDIQIQSQQAVETSTTSPHTHASVAYRENQRLASNSGSPTSSRNLTSLANDTMRRRIEMAYQASPVSADQTSNAERMDADGGLEQEGLTQERVQCNGCGRSFAPAAFSKHTKICAKVINDGLLLTLFPFCQPSLLYIAHTFFLWDIVAFLGWRDISLHTRMQ